MESTSIMLRYLLLLLTLFSPGALALITPYFGIEYEHYDQSIGNAWQSLLARRYQAANILVGTKVLKYISLELGVARSNSQVQKHNFSNTEDFLGFDASGVSVSASNRFSSWHIDSNCLIPLNGNLQLIAGIGFNKLRPGLVAETNTITPSLVDDILKSAFGRSSAIIRYSLGCQYDWSFFALRAMWRYEDTSSVRIGSNIAGATVNASMPFKDRRAISIGIVMNLG